MATKLVPTIDNAAAAAKPARPAKLPMPALGSTCIVRVAEGVVLMNNDTGANFTPETNTPVNVTLSTLRRIEDGDLQLVG